MSEKVSASPGARDAPGGQHLRRRSFLGVAGAAAVAGGVAGALPGGVPALAATAAATSLSGPLAYFDISALNNVSLTDTAALTDAYDQLHLVSSLQGLVNRDTPALFVNFIVGDQFGPINLDQYWLSKLQAAGGWLAGTALNVIPDLDTLVSQFGSAARGAVIWDPNVAATSNVASTVAGADNLVVVRYDPSAGSVYTRFVASGILPAKVWLVNADGSPRFTGTGTIPGTTTPSSGSAKCDAYLWAKIHYLDAGRTNAAELGYYLDAFWLSKPNPQNESFVLPTCALTNHDYLVANKAFVFDLAPFADIEPEDDPDQPLGTDLKTFEAILKSASRRTGSSQMIALHGFLPWGFKYSSSASAGDPHNPVGGEWQSVQILSSYNVYTDADAGPGIESLVNASLYQHMPVPAVNPQNPKPTLADFQAKGYVDASGAVVPKRYVAVYTGDWDSAAWIYHFIPRVWDETVRGSVPMSWAFNPNTEQRFAPALVYTRQTMTANDYFIAGDSGAGYLNPGALVTPRPSSDLPSALGAWTAHCQRYYKRWDISLSGFLIDGFSDALSEEEMAASYGKFSADGVVSQKSYKLGLAGNLPVIQQAGDVPNETPQVAATAIEQDFLTGDTSQPPLQPEFAIVRTVIQGTSYVAGFMAQIQADLPNAAVEHVDAYTLMGLVRQHLARRVSLDPRRALVAAGAATPVLLDAVNHRSSDARVSVSLQAPDGWQVSPATVTVQVPKGQRRRVSFRVTPPASAAAGTSAVLTAQMTGPDGPQDVPFAAQVVAQTFAAAGSVAVTLGTANQSSGLAQIDESFDGPTTATTLGGVDCRQLRVIANGFTTTDSIYFAIDDTFLFEEQDTSARITVDYFDAPGQKFTLEYDARDTGRPLNGIFTTGGTVTTAGTGTWKTHTFSVRNIYFGNRQMPSPDYRAPGVADFRLTSADPIAIASVTVTASRQGNQNSQGNQDR